MKVASALEGLDTSPFDELGAKLADFVSAPGVYWIIFIQEKKRIYM